MCFAGIIGGKHSAGDLRAALSSLTAEGVISVQTFSELDLHLAFAGRGLMNQPLWNEAADICLVWQGELFPERAELSESGKRKLAPNELGVCILQEYEKSGIPALKRLNGWFSGIIIDRRTRQSVLFNDRYGVGRIYVHEKEQTFYFASEARSILSLLPRLRKLDTQSLGEWLSCGCALQNRTLFADIRLLPAGSAWTFDASGRVEQKAYFAPSEWLQVSKLNPSEYLDALCETFSKVLKRYVAGEAAIGMSLTGGLDGRMIMAWSAVKPGSLPCYTFNGSYRDCADVRIARTIASACNQSHHTVTLGEEFLESFPKLANDSVILSDGAMDVTGAAELYANRLALEIAPVRLTGNYGSEILRKHVAFRPSGMLQAGFTPEIVSTCNQASEVYRMERQMDTLAFIAFKQVPWHHYARRSIEQSQLTVRSPFLDNDLVRLAFQSPEEVQSSTDLCLNLIFNGNPMLSRIPTDRGLTWPSSKLLCRLRSQYHELWAKAEYAYDYGMPNWLARLDEKLRPLALEKIFLGRQKFCHFRIWYRHQLKGFLRDTLLSQNAAIQSYFEPRAVEKLIQDHTTGQANHTVVLHKLLSLELIHRHLLKGARLA